MPKRRKRIQNKSSREPQATKSKVRGYARGKKVREIAEMRKVESHGKGYRKRKNVRENYSADATRNILIQSIAHDLRSEKEIEELSKGKKPPRWNKKKKRK